MLPFLVVISQNLSGAVYALLSRRLAVTLPHAQVQVIAMLLTVDYALVLPLAFVYGSVYPEDLLQWWPYLLLGGVAMALNSVLLLYVFKYMDAAMASLITTINVVAAAAAAMYVLGEQLGVQELVGASLVVAAVTYALSVQVSKRERRDWTRGILFTLLSAFCFSVSVVIEKLLLGEMGVTSYMVWGWGAQWIVGVLFAVVLGWRHIRAILTRQHLGLLLGASVARAGMGALFVGSIVMFKSLCIAVILAGLRPLFVAFLGAWLLKERKYMTRKIVASIVAALGVAAMFW